jgi:peptide/nickel transport system permease protein
VNGPKDNPPVAPLEYFVSPAPFDPHVAEALTPEQERFYMASQWRMMWWRIKRHKLALCSGVFLILMYLTIVFSEFLAPYNLHTRHSRSIHAQPQTVHYIHDGAFVGPFVYKIRFRLDMDTMRRVYTEDKSTVLPVRFFCLGDPYEFWGVIPGRFHFVCPPEGGTLFLWGTDRLGHDILSRIIYWVTNLAHRRPNRHRDQLRVRHADRRACGLLRRLGR